MIEILNQLNDTGWFNVLLTLALIIILIPLAIDSWKKFKSSIGLKSVEELENENKKKEIKKLKEDLENLEHKFQRYCKEHEEDCEKWRKRSIDIRGDLVHSIADIKQSLEDIKSNNLSEKIERMRWKILDFASQIRNNRISHPEQFNNVLSTYDDYEKILKENNMSNGQADESIRFIREKYHELLEEK